MSFTYVESEEVTPLLKNSLDEEGTKMLESKLTMLSSQLSGRFLGLREAFLEEEEMVLTGKAPYSNLVDLVKAMVTEAARRFMANPDGMSSETIGVFAYSRFDSGDPLKEAFDPQDLAALKALLDEDSNPQVGSFKLKSGYNMYVGEPTPRPGWTITSRREKNWRR